jgi:hypothetical protein
VVSSWCNAGFLRGLFIDPDDVGVVPPPPPDSLVDFSTDFTMTYPGKYNSSYPRTSEPQISHESVLLVICLPTGLSSATAKV